MHILASVGEPASHTWQDQAVLGHLPQAAGFGLVLNVCSVYSTAPVHPVAGIWLLPRPQGLILSRVGRRRKEAIKCKTCPEMGHTYATQVSPHFGTVVQPGELLGHLPMRSLPYPHKVFRDKGRARATEEQTSKSQECTESAPQAPAQLGLTQHSQPPAVPPSRLLTQCCHSCG